MDSLAGGRGLRGDDASGSFVGSVAGAVMNSWWLLLISRSSRDSATTGLGNSGYQSTGERFEVRIRERLARSLISS